MKKIKGLRLLIPEPELESSVTWSAGLPCLNSSADWD
jgi:hypothetical protein